MTSADGGIPGGSAALPHSETMLQDLERIARVEMPALRNLLITQRYHDLSGALGRVLGPSNANWATFATWASKTAGESIRGEEVPRQLTALLRMEAELEEHLERVTRALALFPAFADLDLFDVARAIVAEVSRQIAEGNLRVFAELAPLFAMFAGEFEDSSRRTQENLASFLERLRPGPPEEGGQDLLKLAFRAYFDASAASTEKQRAELTLYGNLLIGLHEQTRLQPNIAAALNAPLSRRVYADLRPKTTLLLKTAFRPLLVLAYGHIQEAWQRLATRFLMRLTLPGGAAIPLGVDIPAGSNPFPKDLDPLHYLVLIELVQRYDPNLHSTAGSAAINWCVLANRMTFIIDLFRCRQQDRTLFEAPFTLDQRRLLEAGVVPSGRL